MNGRMCRPTSRGSRRAPSHALCICQTMMSSQVRPKALGKAGLTLHSRCQCRSPNETSLGVLQTVILDRENWWSQTGSNRRPHACKARALPTELWPLLGNRIRRACHPFHLARLPGMVGPGRLELPTLRLSGVRSNLLSYGPMAARPEEISYEIAPTGLAIALPT